MTKKIAIVSCYFQPNYGSQLQAYATQLILDKLSVGNETIKITGLVGEIKKAKYKYFLKHVCDADVFVEKIGFLSQKMAKYVKGSAYKNNLQERNKMFSEFASTHFHLSQTYNSKDELREQAAKYAAFLVGSDQLWLPSNIEADYYTLNFVPDDLPKISYATSFGFSKIETAQKGAVKKFIPRIQYLSVREQRGVEIIKEETGCEAALVCDPTLLFDAKEWNALAMQGRMYEAKYILAYFLGADKRHRDFVSDLAKITGHKVVVLQHIDKYVKSDEVIADYAPYSVGPREFIQLIRDAECVVTDSFHATVFSVLFEKKFFTARRFAKQTSVSTNSRIESLLSLLCLEDRLIHPNTSAYEVLKNEINYHEVQSRVSEFRNTSLSFLKTSLKGVGAL